MRDAVTFRFYVPALNRLGAVLRVLVGCAGILRGGTEGADFIDIKLESRRLTFLACKDATARLPICSERTRVDLTRLRVAVDQPDGMVLYLMGRFLPRDMPEATEQIAFDRKLLATGIVDEEGRGPGYAELNEILRRRRAKKASSG